MGGSTRTKMAAGRRGQPAAGKTFTTSGASGTRTNVHIMPYSQPYTEPTYKNSKHPKAKSSKSWSLADPEVKRKRRVLSYKVYTVEGRLKSSLRKSVRWFKTKYIEMRYGWR